VVAALVALCAAGPGCGPREIKASGGAELERGRSGEGSRGAPGSPALPDRTPCGPELVCETSEQVCVERGPMGARTDYACDPVPAECVADRTCACVGPYLCTGAFRACWDLPAPNTISCDCPDCQ
jgi:hypothetical protein